MLNINNFDFMNHAKDKPTLNLNKPSQKNQKFNKWINKPIRHNEKQAHTTSKQTKNK
jgi:hypothetical protein